MLLALKDSFNLTQLPSPNELEIISVEVDSSFIICLLYRSPNSSDQHNSLMISYLTSLDSTKNLILLGDLNLPGIDWDIYSGSSSLADDLAEFAFNHNLVQHISGFTHSAGNTLDIVLSNINSLYHTYTYSALPSGLSSDHYMITLLIDHSSNRPTRVYKQNFD